MASEGHSGTEARDRAIAEIAARVGVRAERGAACELTSCASAERLTGCCGRDEAQAAATVGALDRRADIWRVLGAEAISRDVWIIIRRLSSENKGEAIFSDDRVWSARAIRARLCVDAAGADWRDRGSGGIRARSAARCGERGRYEHEIGTVVETVRIARGGQVIEVAERTSRGLPSYIFS